MSDSSSLQTSVQEAMGNADPTDSDVEILETSEAVVTIDDDVAEVDNSKDTETKPLLEINFRNKDLCLKLKKALASAIETMFEELLPDEPVMVVHGMDGCTMEVLSTGDPICRFVIDSTPMKNKKNDNRIPSYRKSVSKTFDGQTPPSGTSASSKRPRPKQTCWNCEGEHSLKDCKAPRNYARIRQKKEEFQKKNDRYHVDLEQRYGHLEPGNLSGDLRDALGLGSRDLPLHIYKMRTFGYPPGWLEDAKITHSGLQLFGPNGNAVRHSDDSDGEIDNARMKYDVRKIIKFPGFNEAPPKEMFDDSKFYNVPPYMEHMSLENMVQQLEGTLVGGYRRKKLKLSVETGLENSVDSTANTEPIDIEDTGHSPPPSPSIKPEQSPQELEDGELSSDTEATRERPNVDDSVVIVETPVEVISLDDTVQTIPPTEPLSPTLVELQEKQKRLVDELGNASVVSESSFMADILLAENLSAETGNDLPTTEAPCPAPFFIEPPVPPTPPTVAEWTPTERPPEPETFDLGEIMMNKVPYIDEPASMGLKRMSLGTPILSAFTPYNTLPSGEAFSKGVSDVIHFENLPNSTGKYEQMKSLLSNVRQKIHDHMQETEH